MRFDFVQKTDRKLRNSDQKGILVKRPKLGQDLRVDTPSIGPKTIEQVAKAGLAGIIISPNAVLLIERGRLTTGSKAGRFHSCLT